MERSMELRLARQREEKEREWREKQLEQAKKNKDRIKTVNKIIIKIYVFNLKKTQVIIYV